ncbi:MFS transporter [Klebsiella spallanzanii]|uniref:MFS transporter n=1 Tax=Klebsiella spallanzanii TaxID=2587528 RepID=UPI001F3BACEF|nr:MFS transporter [Klebsiella spallanzanii]
MSPLNGPSYVNTLHFQTGFLVASLLTGYFTDKKGLKIMMLIGSLMMAVGLVGTSLAFSLLLVIGFILFYVAAVATKLTDKSGSTMGLIYVASGMGGAFAGWLIGQVSQMYGVSLGFNLIIAFVAIFFVLTFFIRENPEN